MTLTDRMKELIGENYLVSCANNPEGNGSYCNNCFNCKVRDNQDFDKGYEHKHSELSDQLPTITAKVLEDLEALLPADKPPMKVEVTKDSSDLNKMIFAKKKGHNEALAAVRQALRAYCKVEEKQ